MNSNRNTKKALVILSCIIVLGSLIFELKEKLVSKVKGQAGGPTIGTISVQTPGSIEKYAKFEISFAISNTPATNFYFPYDANTPTGVASGTGISVDMLLLPPGEANWTNAKTLPCFFYYPAQEVGSGGSVQLQPTGSGGWRCRFTPDTIGTYTYKIRATDANGTSESSQQQFTSVNSSRKGFIKVSQTDPRFFEFSDGTPFTTPLINVEEGNPFNTISSIRSNIQKLGQGGIKFVRWFPTGEGANYFIIPFGDDIKTSWRFGPGGTYSSAADPASGHLFGYFPYYYSLQDINLTPGKYRLSVRTNVWGDAVLRLELGNYKRIDICSTTGTFHQSQGYTCDYTASGWNDYSIEATVPSNSLQAIAPRALYISTDAPAPFNTVRTGNTSINSIVLQKDETGNGDWSPNLLQRGDTDTYKYIDQIGALAMDELLKVSEQYGVFHKLTVFHKNDALLNTFQANGTIGNWYQCGWGACPNNFYSAPGQAARWYENAYTRYFVARWSYSPSLHSVELGNETDLYTESYNAGWDFAQYFKSTNPHPTLVSNSFWGYFAGSFFADSQKGQFLDYGDKHWYSSASSGNWEVVSTTYADSAAYVRECWKRFKEYITEVPYNKPIVRGEAGSTQTGTQPQHPQIAQEGTGVYYHKKVWAHVGNLGFTCDGEWYPRTFTGGGAYPNATYDTFKIYKTYENFMNGEPVNNGRYQDIGTDLTGNQQITISGQTGSLRAYGVRDASSGKVLLWIDNANQTWKNVADGVAISNAGGTLTLQGLPAGTYQGQWWDTRTGAPTSTQNYTVTGTGTLALTITNLGSDTAIKLTNTTVPTPTITPTPTSMQLSPTPTPAHCTPLGDIDCSGKVNVLDLSVLLGSFGSTTNGGADLDDSGKVNVIDLSILLGNFGK